MRIRLSIWFLASILALESHGATVSSEAHIKLETYRKTIAVRATVGGQQGLFTLDTAGGLSMVTPSFAKKIGCKAWGRLTGFQMKGDRIDAPRCDGVKFKVSDVELTAPVVGVFDIMSLYPEGAEPIDGFLALDVFAGKTITIDFPGKLLTIESEKTVRRRISGAVEIPARIAREVQGYALSMFVGVPTAEGPIWMELDSGNGGTILVNKVYAPLFGLDSAKHDPQKIGFDLVKGLRVEGDGFTPDMVIDGNIGMPFLRNVILTMDLSSGRVWITARRATP
jgi:Aspartyl protease